MRAARALRRPGGIPCLAVPDLSEACEVYAARLGFTDIERLGDPPRAALARRGRAALLLQEVATAGTARRGHGTGTWDALVTVDDVRSAAADLRRRGARVQVGVGISHVSERTLEVRDGCGNVLAFVERKAGPRHLGRTAWAALPARPRALLRQRRLALQERAPRQAFSEFYGALENKDAPFYMFFTEGLLHWVSHAERLVPEDVNLVLIGSDLPGEEEAWIRARLRRPFHNIGLNVDDNTVWEFLFDVNTSDFGWLDIDCFVLDPRLFADLRRIDGSVAVNGVWTYPMPGGELVACTHFVFCNAEVIRRLRAAGRLMSPTNYDWAGSNVSLLHPRTNCRIPDRRQRAALRELLPTDDRGRPVPPGGGPFFDTLVAYQVVATASGYRTRAVRPLAHRTQASLGETGEREWQQDVSDEVVHVGGVSYYARYFHRADLRGMYLAAELTLLERCAADLPAAYESRRQGCRADLRALGIAPDEAGDLVRRHLTADRGLRPESVARILGEDRG